MFYYVSGWDNRGHQYVELHEAENEREAERKFLRSIGGGEVNEILDSFERME